MAVKGKKIIVVIPVYNEADNIRRVLSQFTDSDYNIIVVDDGSTDDTNRIVSSFVDVVLIKHLINRGMGAALQTGDELAIKLGADIIVHFDGDGQMRFDDIKAMIAPLLSGQVDITLGSRFLGKASNIPWFKKYIIQPPAKIINYFFAGLWLSDVHNGFRAMTARAAKQIVIKQDGMAHNTEIPAAVKKLGLKYQEVPVVILYHHFGQGIVGGFKIVKDLIIKKF